MTAVHDCDHDNDLLLNAIEHSEWKALKDSASSVAIKHSILGWIACDLLKSVFHLINKLAAQPYRLHLVAYGSIFDIARRGSPDAHLIVHSS